MANVSSRAKLPRHVYPPDNLPYPHNFAACLAHDPTCVSPIALTARPLACSICLHRRILRLRLFLFCARARARVYFPSCSRTRRTNPFNSLTRGSQFSWLHAYFHATKILGSNDNLRRGGGELWVRSSSNKPAMSCSDPKLYLTFASCTR